MRWLVLICDNLQTVTKTLQHLTSLLNGLRKIIMPRTVGMVAPELVASTFLTSGTHIKSSKKKKRD
jgi:hypothetical protein